MVAKVKDVQEQEPKELTPEEKAIAEMVEPTDAEIRRIVERIAAVKDEIAELMASSGIKDREDSIVALRAELFTLVERRYEIAKANNPLAFYVKEGERISFDASAVDKGLSTLLDLHGQMSTLVKDLPVKRFRVTVNGEAGMATAQDMIEVSGITKAEVVEALLVAQEAHEATIRDFNLRVEAMLKALTEVAAARKTSTVKAHVAVQ